LTGELTDQCLIVGFYSVEGGKFDLWVFGFLRPSVKAGQNETSDSLLASYSFSGTSEISNVENYPEAFLADMLSWIADEPLRICDLNTGALSAAPRLVLAKQDEAKAYANGTRLFVRNDAELSAPVRLEAKGYSPVEIDVAKSRENRYEKIPVTLHADPNAVSFADSFQPSSLQWADKKAYGTSLGKFRTYLGCTAVSLPIAVVCTGWFVQNYETATSSGTNSTWLYVSGGLAGAAVGATVVFLVNAGINFFASLRASQSGSK
jgi:hypothetical protein